MLTRLLTGLFIFLLTLPTGFFSPPRLAPQTEYEFNHAADLPIPANTCVSSTISIPAAAALADLNLGLWIEHTWRVDLDISLTSPGGTTVALLTNVGGPATNFNLLLDDQAAGLPDFISHPAPPPLYAHAWRPEAALAAFAGQNIAGDWTLTVCNDTTNHTGVLHTWSLFIQANVFSLLADRQQQSTCSGRTLRFALTAANHTAITQSTAITYTAAWPVSGPAHTPELAPGEPWQFFVEVAVPGDTPPGASETIQVSLSNGAAATLTASATLFLTDAMPDAPIATAAHSLVYAGGKLYRIGGLAPGWRSISDVSIFDPASREWSAAAPLPEPAFSQDCVAIQGKIYCAGGYSGVDPTSILYIYDIAADSWSAGPDLPAARVGHAAVALDGKLYLIGGNVAGSESASTVVYDPAIDEWSEALPPMSTPRSGAAAGVIGGKIYVVGEHEWSTFDTMEIYDPVAGSWSAPVGVPFDFSHGGDVVLKDRYLMLLGGDRDVRPGRLAVYDTQAASWTVFQIPIATTRLMLEADGDGEQAWSLGGETAYSEFSPQMLNIYACADACALEARPAGLEIRLGTGLAAGQQIEVCNLTQNSLNWSAVSAADWLSAAPTSGLLAGRVCIPVHVLFDTAGLAPGTHRANLGLHCSDPEARKIMVPAQLHVEHWLYLPLTLQ